MKFLPPAVPTRRRWTLGAGFGSRPFFSSEHARDAALSHFGTQLKPTSNPNA
jgi:hypothetical protein